MSKKSFINSKTFVVEKYDSKVIFNSSEAANELSRISVMSHP